MHQVISSRPPKRASNTTFNFRSKNGKIDETDDNSRKKDPDIVDIDDDYEADEKMSNDGETRDGSHNLNSASSAKSKNINWAEMVANAENDNNKKPTPIQLGPSDGGCYDTVLKRLRDKCGASSFEWIQLSKSSLPRIVYTDEVTKNKIMETLRRGQIEINTFGDKNTKKRALYVVYSMEWTMITFR